MPTKHYYRMSVITSSYMALLLAIMQCCRIYGSTTSILASIATISTKLPQLLCRQKNQQP